MYDTEAHEAIMNSVIMIPEDHEEPRPKESKKSTHHHKKSTHHHKKSKKSSKKSSSDSHSNSDSKSSKKSKSKKEKKHSHKSKANRRQSTSDMPQTPHYTSCKNNARRRLSEPLVTPRKPTKKVSFDVSANVVIEAHHRINQGLWWSRTELEAMAEATHEHCIIVKQMEEYVQALEAVHCDTFDTSYSGDALTQEQQQAMNILMQFDDVGRGLEQQITEEASHERIAQHRRATLEAMNRVKNIVQCLAPDNCTRVNQFKCSCSRFVSGLAHTSSRSSQKVAIIMAEIDARHAWSVYSEN